MLFRSGASDVSDTIAQEFDAAPRSLIAEESTDDADVAECRRSFISESSANAGRNRLGRVGHMQQIGRAAGVRAVHVAQLQAQVIGHVVGTHARGIAGAGQAVQTAQGIWPCRAADERAAAVVAMVEIGPAACHLQKADVGAELRAEAKALRREVQQLRRRLDLLERPPRTARWGAAPEGSPGSSGSSAPPPRVTAEQVQRWGEVGCPA